MQIQSLPGDHIQRVITKAVTTAQQEGKAVWFDFNNEIITVYPGDNPERVMDDWQERQDRASREHRASHAYVRSVTERAERTRQAQQTINQLLPQLDAAVKAGIPAVLRWLIDFTGPADRIDVLIPHTRVAATLATLAPAHIHVGRKDLDEPGNETDAALWVIGQAVACLESGKPPHPVLMKLAEDTLGRMGLAR